MSSRSTWKCLAWTAWRRCVSSCAALPCPSSSSALTRKRVATPHSKPSRWVPWIFSQSQRTPRGDMVILSDGPPVNGHRPSADVLFHSVAQEFALTSVGILMTGMGDDGAEGLGAIKAAGGMTIAQSEDTCVVSGMPRAAIIKGYANKIVALESLGTFLVGHCGSDRAPERDRSEEDDRREKIEKKEKSDRTHVSSHRS